MAKKNEFRPDRPYSNWFSRLHLTQQQRRHLLKWVLYALLLLVMSIAQDVVLCRFRLFGATTDLVPCGIFLICLLEGVQTGSVFTLIAACLYTFSGSAPGPYCIPLITVLAVCITLFRQAYLQRGFLVALVCCVVAVFAYEMSLFLIGAVLKLTPWSRWIGFVITAGLSLIPAPVLYPICLAIESIGGQTWKE